MSAILARQAFAADITQALWAANEFLNAAKDDSQWVDHDKVNLPHAGAIPTVVKNRSTKGEAQKRTDVATQYALHELSSDPTWIQYSEEMIVNYNKRQSVLEEHKGALIDAVADNGAHDWAAGGDSEGSTKPTIIRTSGTARPVGLAQIGGTAPTGNRKGVAFKDILDVITVLNKHNLSQAGRNAMITADMLADLLQIEEFANSDYIDRKPIPDAPVSFRWLGMTWYVRSKVNVFTNAATPVLKAVGAASAATDNAAALFWHKDMVRKAKGGVKVFLNLADAELYGDKMSALVRYGSIGARKDCKGIVNLVEAAAT
jgi:hypothetical protein